MIRAVRAHDEARQRPPEHRWNGHPQDRQHRLHVHGGGASGHLRKVGSMERTSVCTGWRFWSTFFFVSCLRSRGELSNHTVAASADCVYVLPLLHKSLGRRFFFFYPRRQKKEQEGRFCSVDVFFFYSPAACSSIIRMKILLL